MGGRIFWKIRSGGGRNFQKIAKFPPPPPTIDLFTDNDTILITSLFAMHCGLSAVYEIQNKELLQEKTRLKEEKL